MDDLDRSVMPCVESSYCRRFRWALPTLLVLACAALATAQAAAELVCTDFFKPAKTTEFPFAWRQNNRCEGLTNEAVAYSNYSVKISSFGFGKLSAHGRQVIANPTSREIELQGRYFSKSKFYRLVARIEPGGSIEWEFPDQLAEGNEKRLERIWLQASVPGDTGEALTPYRISDSPDLYLGVMSTDLQFNAVHVEIIDEQDREICNYTHDLKRIVQKRDQASFKLRPCSQALSPKARLSVRALMIFGDKDLNRKNSTPDVVWIRQ